VFLIPVALFVFYTPYFKGADNHYPLYYFLLNAFVMALNIFLESSTAVMQGGFVAKISDPRIGGTMMTMWAAISNMGMTLDACLS
jgi:hypothetical protein